MVQCSGVGRNVSVRTASAEQGFPGVMLETRSVRAADSVWANKPLPAPHAMANSRHGKNAQVKLTIDLW